MNSSKFNENSAIALENLCIGSNDRQKVSVNCNPVAQADQLRRSGSAYCPVCQKPVELLSFARSAELFKTDVHDIDFLAKRGELHRVHNRKGELMVCSNSLFDCFDSRDTRLLDSHFEIEMQKSFETKLGK